jgi:tRNA threonylcarbamoyladenosine biosynthesis protein TsaB
LETVTPEAVCESRDILILAAADFAAGRTLAPEQALPVYLRDRVTSVPQARSGG